MKVLGHKTVDIVKIDVEGYEVYLWHQLFDPAMGMPCCAVVRRADLDTQ